MSFYRKKSFRLLMGLVTMPVVLLASFLAFRWTNFMSHRDQLSFQIGAGNFRQSSEELEKLRADYQDFDFPGVRYLADRFLFNEMFYYEALVAYLGEDYEKVLLVSEGHRDDHRFLYLQGNAKFKILQAAFQADKSVAGRAEILKKVLNEVATDFQEVVKKGPGPADAFNYSWNYDLTSDPKNAERALKSIKPKPRFVLKFTAGDGEGPGKKLGKRGADPLINLDGEKKDVGAGDAKRRG